MTGWRIGYIGAPKSLADAIGAIQSHGTHHPANASQHAALACLEDDRGFPGQLREHLDECRTLALSRLESIPGLEVFPPQGAFYAFFGVQAYLGRSSGGKRFDTSLALCEYLLDDQLVAAVPGSAFGMEGFIRISFANSIPTLREALDRLERGLLALAG
jgi:aspartate aminotransferase